MDQNLGLVVGSPKHNRLVEEFGVFTIWIPADCAKDRYIRAERLKGAEGPTYCDREQNPQNDLVQNQVRRRYVVPTVRLQNQGESLICLLNTAP